MLSEVKKRLEGPKFNIDFGGEGVGVDRGRILILKVRVFGTRKWPVIKRYNSEKV